MSNFNLLQVYYFGSLGDSLVSISFGSFVILSLLGKYPLYIKLTVVYRVFFGTSGIPLSLVKT